MTAFVPAQMGLPNCLVPSVPKIKMNPDSCGKPSPVHGFLEMRIKSKETIGWLKFIDKVPFLIFGRDLGACHVFVGHPSVSAQHAFAYWDISTGYCMIQDLESEHGTSVNGCSISHMQPIALNLKDSVRFGSSAHVYIFDYLPPEFRDDDGSASAPPPMPPLDARTEASGPSMAPVPRRMSGSPRRGSDPHPMRGTPPPPPYRRSPGRDPPSGEFPPRMHDRPHPPGPPGGGRWSPGRERGDPWRDDGFDRPMGRGHTMDGGYDRRPMPGDREPLPPPDRFPPPPNRRYSRSPPPRSWGPRDDEYDNRMRMGTPSHRRGEFEGDMGGRGRGRMDDFDHERGGGRGYGRPEFVGEEPRHGPPRQFDERERGGRWQPPHEFDERDGAGPGRGFSDGDGGRRRYDDRDAPGGYRGRGRGDMGYNRDDEEFRRREDRGGGRGRW